MSALVEARHAYPAVACYTVGWWKPEDGEGRLTLPYAFPPSDACTQRGATPKEWGAASLYEVLTRRHFEDTWFQAVAWPGRDRWPRLAKAILLDEARDQSPGLAYVVVDLDRPDHTGSPWGSADEAYEAVWETAHRLGCSVYATRGGLRAIWVLERLIPLELAQSYLNGFHATLPGDLPVDPDRGVKDWTRGFRVPFCPRADGKKAAWEGLLPPMMLEPLLDGEVLRWDESELANETTFRAVPVDWRVSDPNDRNTKRVEGWFAKQLDELRNASSRHAVLIAKARALGGLCRGAIERAREPGAVDPEPFVRALITATNTTNAERTARQALDYGAAEPWWFEEDEPMDKTPSRKGRVLQVVPSPPPDPGSPPDEVYDEEARRRSRPRPQQTVLEQCLELPYTDLGNARRFALHFGESVRWCQAKQSWLVWQGSHWAWDERMAVLQLAQETVDRIRLEVLEWQRQALEEDDRAERDKLETRADAASKHHVKSQATGRIRAILEQARGLPGIPVSMDDFDRDPWLLTVDNGTIELRSQLCRPHRREDLIRRVAPVVFDPAATCPLWERFVLEVFPDPEVRHFVQRAIGYSLTGDISEQVWFLLQGEGSNGKSTLLEVVAALLGEYATALPAGFLEYRKHEQHPTELTDLHRTRFATGTEPRADEKWDAEKIKRLTGGDRIKARFMRGDFFEFEPTQKLLVSCNDMPRTSDLGTGFWRRVVIIPFVKRWFREDEEGTPKVDPELPRKLRGELAGILNWALLGLKDWREGGLRIPVPCRLATQEYRKDQDHFPRFVEECCALGEGFSVKLAVLHQAYLKWHRAQSIDDKPLSKVQLGKRLSAPPYKTTSYEGHARAATRGGIRLLTADELDARDGEEPTSDYPEDDDAGDDDAR